MATAPPASRAPPTAQTSFEQIRQNQEAIVRLAGWRELHHDVDVTAGVGLAAQDRAEQRKPVHAQGPDLLLALSQALTDLDAVENWSRNRGSVLPCAAKAQPTGVPAQYLRSTRHYKKRVTP